MKDSGVTEAMVWLIALKSSAMAFFVALAKEGVEPKLASWRQRLAYVSLVALLALCVSILITQYLKLPSAVNTAVSGILAYFGVEGFIAIFSRISQRYLPSVAEGDDDDSK